MNWQAFVGHRRFAVLSASLLIAGEMVGLALFTSTGPRNTVLAEHCRPGTVPAEGPTSAANGDHADRGQRDHGARLVCVPMGQPETFADLGRANAQLGARDTAPFSNSAPGAYQHAYAQRASLLRHRAALGAGAVWRVAGKAPECAAPTAGSSTCPAAGPENGNYSYTATLGFRTLSGRISSFAYDPGTQGRLFASPVVGGVWETRNSGVTWRSVGERLPTQVVGAIAYDAPVHRIVVGTGDNSFGGDGIAGHGVFFSDNDGASWKTARGIPDLALSFKVLVSPADPTGKTVYAATSKGLFRSQDGGASFQNDNLPTTPAGYSPSCAGNTSNHLCFFANDVTDVIVKPRATGNGQAGAVIAAVGWRAGQKVDKDAAGNPVSGCKLDGAVTSCEQAPQNGLYESDSGRPGSFHYLATGSGGISGLPPTAIFGRTALAIAHGAGQNSDAVYALVQDAQKFNGCPDVLDRPATPQACNATVQGQAVATALDGMFASYDFGRTWTKVMDFSQLKQVGTGSSLTAEAGYSPGIQSWYNLWVDVDPTAKDGSGNPTRILFGLEEIWESNPNLPSTGTGGVLTSPFPVYPGGGFATDPWIVIGRYWNACGGVNTPVGPCNPNPYSGGALPGTTTHPDQHAEAMIPDGSGGVTLFTGSDGGAYSQHVAAGHTFSNDSWGDGLNATLPTVQAYDAEMAKDGTIVSGLQDNGEMKTAPSGHQAEIYGGDAFYTTIDPGKSQNIIEEYTNASQVNLSNDGGATWNAITPGASGCGTSANSLFSTPIEQDPTMSGHILIGCQQIQEATNAYSLQCVDPSCQTVNSPFNTVFDLSTLPSPNGAPNIPSAVAVRGANAYVGYCGYCDPATQNIPFANGIATNVGGSAPAQIGSSAGWHRASANCTGCATANGKLPARYITSIQEDPRNPKTVYVTLGGYGRRWIPPGSFGEDTTNVGVGHVFVSRDAGEHFTNISGNLPDIPANWTLVHGQALVVATDLGVYIATSGVGQRLTYGVLGTGLPAVPVFTVRASPADSNLLLVATFGRGDYEYRFPPGGGSGGGPGGSGSGRGSRLCARPTGRISGRRLGPLALGFTRARALRAMHRVGRAGYGFDDFCLRGGPGIRAAFPTPKLLRSRSLPQRAAIAGRIVFLLTANRHYALAGVRPGTPLRAVRGRLKLRRSFQIGINQWCLIPGRAAMGVLKVRGGVIREVGIADASLNRTVRAQRLFLASFS